MNRGGLLLLILSIVILIGVTWINSTWLSYSRFKVTQKQKKIDFYLSEFTLLNTQENGEMRYFLTAKNLVHQESTASREIYRPLLQVRDSDGALLTLTSDKAEQINDGDIHLLDKVSITKNSVNKNGDFELTTHNLIYNPIKKKLSSQAEVKLKTPQGELTGVGFSSKLDQQELRIHSNVHIQFDPSK